MDELRRRVVSVVDDDYRVLESLESLLASSGFVVRLFYLGRRLHARL